MSQRQPGLPTSFRMPVDGDALEDLRPASVGDFLDEDDSIGKGRPSVDLGTNVVSFEKKGPASEPELARPSLAMAAAPAARDSQTPVSKIDERPRRRQVNMTPETMRMIDELLALTTRYSNEPNPSVSEVIQALIRVAYDSQLTLTLNLSSVPARGAWGSPAADIFANSLKSAFEAAIAQHHAGKE